MWVNEENGNQGGETYARDYAYTLNKTSIAFETDEGPFSPWTLGFSGHEAALNQLKILAPLLDPISAGNVTAGGGGEDISPMANSNVPQGGVIVRDPRATNLSNNPCRDMMSETDFSNLALGSKTGISDGYFWYHHSAADNMETVDSKQLQILTAYLAVWAVAIADLPELLPRSGNVPPYTPAPSNNNVVPPSPSPSPNEQCDPFHAPDKFAGAFIGGIILGVGLVAIGYFVVSWYRNKKGGRRSATDGDYISA
jgi:hypothetical protein